ncbi:MAG: hypothetical protein ABSE82_16325 [Nitrososphaerales archaeon]
MGSFPIADHTLGTVELARNAIILGMRSLRVQIVRFVDEEPQPGIVESQFHDAQGQLHSIIDKVPLFTSAHLWSDSDYPQPGFIECRVVERIPCASGNLARINIEPYRFEITNESPEFVVSEAELAEIVPFRYGGFWDVPRPILLRYREMTLLLQSPFDDRMDEYSNVYSVYEVPDAISKSVLGGDWAPLEGAELRFVGEIPISTVAFDPTKRRTLDSSCLEHLFSARE